jgi:hypothetical protein
VFDLFNNSNTPAPADAVVVQLPARDVCPHCRSTLAFVGEGRGPHAASPPCRLVLQLRRYRCNVADDATGQKRKSQSSFYDFPKLLSS